MLFLPVTNDSNIFPLQILLSRQLCGLWCSIAICRTSRSQPIPAFEPELKKPIAIFICNVLVGKRFQREAVGNCIQWVVGSDSKYTNYLMNQPRNPEHTINEESQWLKTVKQLDSKLQKQRQGWPKILNTARKIQQRWKSAKLRQRSSNVLASTFWATIG